MTLSNKTLTRVATKVQVQCLYDHLKIESNPTYTWSMNLPIGKDFCSHCFSFIAISSTPVHGHQQDWQSITRIATKSSTVISPKSKESLHTKKNVKKSGQCLYGGGGAQWTNTGVDVEIANYAY